MRLEVLTLALLLVTAGCMTATEDGQAPGNDTRPASGDEVRRVERTLTFHDDIEQPGVGGDRVGPSWSAKLGVGLVDLTLELSWTEPVNRLGLDVKRPDGTVYTVSPPGEPGATSARGNVTELEPGTYTFYLTAAQGPVVPDNVTVEAHAAWRLSTVASPVAEGGTVEGPVRTEQTDDGWLATIVYRTNGTVLDRVQVRSDTTNGRIWHGGTAQQAQGTVEAWARGDTEEQATRRVREIDVTLTLDESEITAVASAPDWEHRGAHVSTGTPDGTTTPLNLDTTNGAITLDEATVDGVRASTTNGAVQGSLAGTGSIEFDTTNGAVDVSLDPTGSVELSAETTNGAITLGLRETSEIAYEIDAQTTNGEISEQMDEAHLEGDEHAATLVTENGQGRPTQVTGNTETTNGRITFVGR